MSTVNHAFPGNWQGLFYQDTIGFWAAALSQTEMDFDGMGRLTSFTHGPRTSYDRSDRNAQRVPEPATWLLLAGGLATIGFFRSRR